MNTNSPGLVDKDRFAFVTWLYFLKYYILTVEDPILK